MTFGLAASAPSKAPRTLQVSLRAKGRLLGEHRLDGRTGSSYRRAAVAFEGTGRAGTLELDLRVTDAAGRAMPVPMGTAFVVTEPTLFDRDSIRGVVLISIDILRRDQVGLHGHPGATTPRIDALGRQGIVCDGAVSASSWTLPAHLSMLTSVEPSARSRCSMPSARSPSFSSSISTIPLALRAARGIAWVERGRCRRADGRSWG